MSPALARRLNAVFVLAMCAMLLGAYGVQFILIAVALGIATMLLLDGQFVSEAVPPSGFPVHGLARTAFALALILSVGNAVTVLLMCGLSECPDNPTRYLWLR